MRDASGLGVDLDLGAGAADHPIRRDVGRQAGRHGRATRSRHEAAGADDVAGLHAVFAAEQISRDRQRCCLPARRLGGERRELRARVLGRQAHRMTHVEGRARAERPHVVGRHVGVGWTTAPLRPRCPAPRRRSAPSRCRSPGPCRPCRNRASQLPSAVTIDDRDRGGRRNAGLDADGDAAAAPDRAAAAHRTAAASHSRAIRSSTASIGVLRITVPVACGRRRAAGSCGGTRPGRCRARGR